MKKKDTTDDSVSAENKVLNYRIQQEEELVRMQRELRDSNAIPQDHFGDGESIIPSGNEENKNTEQKTETPEPKKTEGPNEEEFDTLIVNGVEQKVEKSKVYDQGKRAMQKELAADAKMKEASDMMKQAEKEREDIKALREDVEKLAKQDKNDLLSDEDIESITQAIKYGDDSESTKAVKKLLAKQQGAEQETATEAITKEDIKAIVREENDIKAFESALEKAKRPADQGGYGDLFDGGILEQAFIAEDIRLSKEKPELTYEDRFSEVGKGVRAAFQKTPVEETPKEPTNKTNTPKNDSSNEARKAELSDSPTSISHQVTQETPKDRSTRQHDLIAAEAASRRGG